ncbi:hypothetical protein VCYphi_gp05 [Vibrio phage VCY]|uniref:Major coat protein n=1 Tax=Vibrio phage VCY TaxID=1105327 RepID=G8IRU8_9VIRU|nr:hypothetical protein [Vibrio cholerae]YP_004934227.1 hypothetical protein VCYphi_gp05 [Vibrio phage VCY-phi]AER41420.1 hypothetical protein [Vibrio phage VCY-phi]EGR1858282.1 hypothetical protein [Vibrio cholerae]EHV2409059.1 hypothetical protein [Vibrio cholerae]EJL6630013.1 hypothetical protein [Vibrio cholerae]KQA78789.1 hypothetical protein XV86_16795 [Vibrio cholerae]
MKFRNMAKKFGVVVAASVPSYGVFAADDISAQLTAAITSGQANYTMVVVGVIGLAAIAFGLGRILGILK